VTAALSATPDATGSPGEPVTLDASASVADVCSGPLLYRFWVDGEADGDLDGPWDVVLRDWTDDPALVLAPTYTQRFVVEVQCASRTSCSSQSATVVTVPCPAVPPPFTKTLLFHDPGVLLWDVYGSTAPVDVVRGDLGALRGSGGQFAGTVQTCLLSHARDYRVIDTAQPAAAQAFYYLVRAGDMSPDCARSWGTGVPQEAPGAGGDRDADLASDPATCP